MELISFCIPCYRSENTIEEVIKEIEVKMVERSEEFDYEIVAVVDGSPDNVWSVLKRLAQNNSRIKAINLSKNYSQANARMVSLNYSKGDYVVCLDDDGQCPVDRLWDMVDPLRNRCDVTVAQYRVKKQSKFKNFGSRINKLMINIILSPPKGFSMSNFYAMRRYVADEVVRYKNPYPYLTGLLLSITDNFEHIPMEERERISGTTGYNFKKMLSLWLNGFTNFSVKPLRISSILGSACAIFGFILGIVIILRRIFLTNVTAGWTSIVAIVLFVGGLNMLMMGMIGEYIGRMFICINNLPQYVVKETVNVNEE